MKSTDLHVMIDLETLAIEPRAKIISIGAVAFEDGTCIDEFYLEVGHYQWGREETPDTVAWWLKQPIPIPGTGSPVTLPYALARFAAWCSPHKDGWFWSYGAAFDIPILVDAFQQYGIKRPWHYRSEMCMRTLKALNPGFPYKSVFVGNEHNAHDDARFQMFKLMELLKAREINHAVQTNQVETTS